MKKKILALSIISLLTALSIPLGYSRKNPRLEKPVLMEGNILDCHDGDTCTFQNKDGLRMTLRLLGIDAPELAKTFGPKKSRNAGQIYGKEAKDYINTRIKGKTMKIEVHGTDVYGRYLALIMDESLPFPSKTINEEMIQKGYAYAYDGRDQEPAIVQWAQAAEGIAKISKRGFWALPQKPENPGDFRKSHR